MRAAIYARRSTEEHQAASLDVQLEEARRYIQAKGWSLEEGHTYIEDAVSRAEFKKRPALIAMLNAASTKAFDVVVVRDETRLGGDVNRTGLLIQDLLEAGARLFYYFTDEEVILDGAVAKFMVAARNFAAELEREKISQRVGEHLRTKARKGLNAGGRVYGYDNVRVGNQVEYRINEEQAAVVRQLFQLRTEGHGYRTLAWKLNEQGVPPPRAGKRGTGSWSPSAIRSMLSNHKYVGVFVYGKFEKTYRGGTKVRIPRKKCEWLRAEVPELAIIDRELFESVQPKQRNAETAAPKRAGFKAKNLLTGLAKCAECGGPMHTVRGKFGSEKIRLYVCAWHRNRGAAVCKNTLRRPADAVEGALVACFKERLLKEEIVVETIREVPSASRSVRRPAALTSASSRRVRLLSPDG